MPELFINGNTSNSRKLTTAQDRPVPIESHGNSEIVLNQLLKKIEEGLDTIKSPGTRNAFEEVLEAIAILRRTKTQFDATRENIEILWKRLAFLSGNISAGGGSQVSTPVATTPGTPVIPPVVSTVKDNILFAYEEAGYQAISAVVTALTLDTLINSDSAYNFTAGNSFVEILKGGSFEIDVDLSLFVDEGNIVEIYLERDTGSGYSAVPGSHSYHSV